MSAPAWRLLALDYDRTLVMPGERVRWGVVRALRRARKAGLLLAVCSGQPFRVLQDALPPVDAIVAENGAVVWARGDPGPERQPWPGREALLRHLAERGVPFEAFDVIVSVPRGAGVADLPLAELGAKVVPNVDALNIQPRGVDKGTGLAQVQRRLHVPAEATVAVGDGENDVALFARAGLRVAPANATPEAATAAQLRLDLPNGRGVRRLIRAVLAGEV